MIKSATITFHCSYNYGSALQAYALQRFLEDNGIENEIIDYRSKDFDQYRLIPNSVSKKCAKQFLRTLCFFPQYMKRKSSFQSFLHNTLKCTNRVYRDWKDLKELGEKYDAYICGSDQIWNMDCTKGVNPAFFLEFVSEGRKKIAYAPSLAKGKFKKDYSEDLRRALKGFDAVSVREESTIPFIQSLTDKKVTAVLDPTLLLPADSYSLKKPEMLDEEEYIFVYMLGYEEELLSYCRQLSKKYSLPVFYITDIERIKYRRELTGKDVFGATPEEFLYYIAHAKYILTTSFHATAFSILFQKQFCTLHRKHTKARTVSLLENLGISDREYCPGFIMDKPVNYEEVKHKLEALKQESVHYLLDALDVKQ